MIGISKLYCGTVESSDVLRYGAPHSKHLPSHLLQFSADKKPVVVWNCTRRCNLRCVHCYSKSADCDYGGELTHNQGLALLEDLAQFGSPVVLFSGGEPLLQIWTDLSHPIMLRLKDKRPYVKGRCAACRYLDICGGNFRVRAEAATGDLWADEPACYLTDEEIAPDAIMETADRG